MQYVGNASLDESGEPIAGVAFTAAPENLDAFVEYAREEFREPWIDFVGRSLQPHSGSTAGWIGAFLTTSAPAGAAEGTATEVVLQIWDERHQARVLERVGLRNNVAMYLLQADGQS